MLLAALHAAGQPLRRCSGLSLRELLC